MRSLSPSLFPFFIFPSKPGTHGTSDLGILNTERFTLFPYFHSLANPQSLTPGLPFPRWYLSVLSLQRWLDNCSLVSDLHFIPHCSSLHVWCFLAVHIQVLPSITVTSSASHIVISILSWLLHIDLIFILSFLSIHSHTRPRGVNQWPIYLNISKL